MTGIKRSPRDFSVQDLDRELIARGSRIPAGKRLDFKDIEGTHARGEMMQAAEKLYHTGTPIPLNPALSHIDSRELSRALVIKIRELEYKKALRGAGMRMDMYQVACPDIKRNARAVASIWVEDNISNNGRVSFLRHKKYGESFNLCRGEPYYHQPIAGCRLCTGFLVEKDVIATAGHCADWGSVKALRFVFGYQMKDAGCPRTQVPDDDVYKGIKIIQRVYEPMGSGADWALVKLDREVCGRETLPLAKTDICPDTSVYVLGHPCGLPLKYVPGEPVKKVESAYFAADLSIYGGNSGSPVFDSQTNEVVGIVVRGDQQDFRWTGNGWISIHYPDPGFESTPPECTKVSMFGKYCQ
jgi:hypothetical protein